MHATVRRYEGVDKSRTDELTKKVGESLLPRIRKRRLQLLVAHPCGCDASRLVGLGRSVEEADRPHDAFAGLDEVEAAEAR